MSRSNWLFIAVVVGCLILGTVEKGRAAQPKQQRAQNEIADSLRQLDATIKKANESGDLNRQCKSEQENRSSQLCAYWKAADEGERSANWARNTFIITALTMVAAVVAAIYAGKAAHHTSRNADEAKRSADIAASSISVQREVGQAQVRCYLNIVSAKARYRSKQLCVSIRIKNTGSSPARNLRWYYMYHIDTDGGSIRRSPDCAMPSEGFSEEIAASDEWESGYLVCINEIDGPDGILLDKYPPGRIMVDIVVDFRDVFGIEFHEVHTFMGFYREGNPEIELAKWTRGVQRTQYPAA